MEKQEKAIILEELREAQEKLFEAIELIEMAIEGTKSEANTKAYLVDHLKIMASNNHDFLSNDLNIDKIIEDIENET